MRKDREGGLNRLLVRQSSQPLRCYSNGDLMEGRVDNLTGLHLGRSIDYSCQGLQHFWVGYWCCKPLHWLCCPTD